MNKKSLLILAFLILLYLKIAGGNTGESIGFSDSVSVSVSSGISPIFGGGGTQSDETIICRKVYYFIIDKINGRGDIIYTPDDLENLASDISLELGILFTSEMTISYIENFDEKCNFTGLEIPFVKENFPVLNQTSNNPECSPLINKKILGLGLDGSIPWWGWKGFYIGEKTCEQINRDKWFFAYENVNGLYVWKGIRAYWLIIFFGVLFTLFTLNLIRKEIKLIEKVDDEFIKTNKFLVMFFFYYLFFI